MASSLVVQKDSGPKAAVACVQRFVDRVLRLIVMSLRDRPSATRGTSTVADEEALTTIPSLRDFVLAQLFCAAADGTLQTVQEVALLCGWIPSEDDEDISNGGCTSSLSWSWSATFRRPVPTWLSEYGDDELRSVFAAADGDELDGAPTPVTFANEPFQLLHYCAVSPHPDILEFVLLHKSLFETALGLRAETSAPSKAMSVSRVEILGGITPLHLACATGAVSGVRALIAFGANLRVKREGGRSALDDAATAAVEVQLEALPQIASRRVSVSVSPVPTLNPSVNRGIASQQALAPAASSSLTPSNPFFLIAMILVAQGGESTYVSRVAGEHCMKETTRHNSNKKKQANNVSHIAEDLTRTSSSVNSPATAAIRSAEEKQLVVLARMKTFMDLAADEVRRRVACGLRIDTAASEAAVSTQDGASMAVVAKKSGLQRSSDDAASSRRAAIENEGLPSFRTVLSKCIKGRLKRQHYARVAALAETPGLATGAECGVKIGDFVIVATSSRFLNTRSLTSSVVSRLIETRAREEILHRANALGFSMIETHQGGVGDGYFSMSPIKSVRTGWAAGVADSVHHPVHGILHLPPTTPLAGLESSTVATSPPQRHHPQPHQQPQQNLTVEGGAGLRGGDHLQASLHETTLAVPLQQQQQSIGGIPRRRRRLVEPPVHFVELSENCSSQSGAAVFSADVLAGKASAIVGEVMFIGYLPNGLTRSLLDDAEREAEEYDGEVTENQRLFVGLRVEPRFANCDGTYCYDGIRHFEGRAGGEAESGLLCGLYVPAADVTVVKSSCGRRIASHRLVRSVRDTRSTEALVSKLAEKHHNKLTTTSDLSSSRHAADRPSPQGDPVRAEKGATRRIVAASTSSSSSFHAPSSPTTIASPSTILSVTVVQGSPLRHAVQASTTLAAVKSSTPTPISLPHQQQQQQAVLGEADGYEKRSHTSMSHAHEMRRIFKQKKLLEIEQVARLRKPL